MGRPAKLHQPSATATALSTRSNELPVSSPRPSVARDKPAIVSIDWLRPGSEPSARDRGCADHRPAGGSQGAAGEDRGSGGLG